MNKKQQIIILLIALSLIFLILSIIMVFDYNNFLVAGYKSSMLQKNPGGEVGITVLKLISGLVDYGI